MYYTCTVKRGIKDSQKSELLLKSSLFIKAVKGSAEAQVEAQLKGLSQKLIFIES